MATKNRVGELVMILGCLFRGSRTSYSSRLYCCFILMFLLPMVGEAQIGSGQAKESVEVVEEERTNSKIKINSGVREELHRYMGYEELLPKYISLPYDVSMNTNIGGPFLDISFLLIMFLPIVLLLSIRHKGLKLLTAILMLFFLIVSIPSGYRANRVLSSDKVAEVVGNELGETAFGTFPLVNIKLRFTEFCNELYFPFHRRVIEKISGEGDSITYPIFLAIFFLAFVLLNNWLTVKRQKIQALAVFLLVYYFLWLILGAGVIWYGILAIPLSLIFIAVAIFNEKRASFLKYAFAGFVSLWLLGATTHRFANYAAPLTSEEIKAGGQQSQMNTGAIHAGPLFYGLGKVSEASLSDQLYPGYRPVAEIINADPKAFVYRIGTYFQYFIDDNSERVLEDNQLAYFNNLLKVTTERQELLNMLKSQNYYYIIVDFNVASIDRTPDETLRKKAMDFEKFLRGNEGLQVIGTDRIVVNERGQRVYGLAGRQILSTGTFVAFKVK